MSERPIAIVNDCRSPVSASRAKGGEMSATNLLPPPEKTSETDTVCNGEFLRAVFGDKLGDTRSVVVSFEGNPVHVAKSAWLGRAWTGHAARLPASVPTTISAWRCSAPTRRDSTGGRRHTFMRSMS